MQQYKSLFSSPDLSKKATIQSCIRTNDLDLIGDGTHLTYFQMVGNFSFGNNDYSDTAEMWSKIIRDLGIQIDPIHVHPDKPDHHKLWQSLGHSTVDDSDCVWSDGSIGGYCCEMYVGDLEIGNLVNTLGHSVDVGFGLERLMQVIEGTSRVDETSLFTQGNPIAKDHIRCLNALYEQGIHPGNTGRHYVVRKLLRRLLPLYEGQEILFGSWLESERDLVNNKVQQAQRYWNRHKNKSSEWWFNTWGVFPEDLNRGES